MEPLSASESAAQLKEEKKGGDGKEGEDKKPKFIEVKGVVYDAAFGKIVRAEDREQARINEGKRSAFWNTRGKALEGIMEKRKKTDRAQGLHFDDSHYDGLKDE